MKTVREESLESALRQCIASPARHRRFLNTLSLLENIGAQKIHRFQRFGFRSEFVLQHAAEEARHALFFKKAANKLNGLGDEKFGDDRLSMDLVSRQYLRHLDVMVNRHIKSKLGISGRNQLILAYLLVTLLIELRANALYATYERVLRELGSPLSLKSILTEEARHLDEIRVCLNEELGESAVPVIAELELAEYSIYQQWISRIFEPLQRKVR